MSIWSIIIPIIIILIILIVIILLSTSAKAGKSGKTSKLGKAAKAGGLGGPVPEGGLCAQGSSTCAEGTTCQFTASTGFRCIAPKEPGGKCTINSDCESGKCVLFSCATNSGSVAKGSTCTLGGVSCESGTTCLPSDNLYKCLSPKKPGQGCTLNSDCESGKCLLAQCADSTGALPENSTCSLGGAKCTSGTVCLPSGRLYKCLKPKAIGEKCSLNQDCASGKCILTNCANSNGTIAKNSTCSLGGSACESGTTCLPADGVYKCLSPKALGENCTLDKDCASGKCVLTHCINSDGTVPSGGVCSLGGAVCASGTSCQPSEGVYKCQPLKSAGSNCTLNTDCASNKCVLTVCSNADGTVSSGSPCSLGGVSCQSGTSCQSSGSLYRCVAKKAIGDGCTLDQDCSSGKCVLAHCVDPSGRVPIGGVCSAGGVACVSGSTCKADGVLWRCKSTSNDCNCNWLKDHVGKNPTTCTATATGYTANWPFGIDKPKYCPGVWHTKGNNCSCDL